MTFTQIGGLIVACLSLVMSYWFGQRNVNKDKTKDEVDSATSNAMIAAELKTISRNTDEIKYEMRDVRNEIQRIGKEQIELSINYIHLEKRVEKVENKIAED